MDPGSYFHYNPSKTDFGLLSKYISLTAYQVRTEFIPITKWFSEFQNRSLPEILIYRLNKTRNLVMISRKFCDRERSKSSGEIGF